MNRAILATIAAEFCLAGLATGHGIPIVVNVHNVETLVVSGGTADANGFASQIFFNGDIDARLSPQTLPFPYNKVAVTDQPGFVVNDMEVGDNLYMQVIPRPVKGAAPGTSRLLWHWDPDSQLVQPAVNTNLMYVIGEHNDVFDEIFITQAGAPVPDELHVAFPEFDQIGEHEHYLRYMLDNNQTADIGAYGFFAQLDSPFYEPSEPFLVMFNNGLSASQLATASFAINAAASDFIPGDYDNSGTVNDDDYQYWRKRFGNSVMPSVSPDGNGSGKVDAADYIVWRNAMGQGASAFATSVPEPGGAFLGVAAIVFLLACRRRGSLSRGHASTVLDVRQP